MKKIIILLFSVALAFGSALSASAATYTVQKGDTLYLISKKYETSLTQILRLNSHLKNPDLIYPLQLINVPDKSNIAQESSSEAQAVLKLVNEERAKQGLSSLKLSTKLNSIAYDKSKDMAVNGYFSHNSPTYGTPFQMLKQYGISYKTAGENIAAGQKTPAEVMKSWMNSSGHRANILNKNYTELGVGYYKGGQYGAYWTQTFIGN